MCFFEIPSLSLFTWMTPHGNRSRKPDSFPGDNEPQFAAFTNVTSVLNLRWENVALPLFPQAGSCLRGHEVLHFPPGSAGRPASREARVVGRSLRMPRGPPRGRGATPTDFGD